MNPAAAGKMYPATTFTVDPQRVTAFRKIFEGSEGVPVTFVTTAEFSVMPQIVADPELALDFSRVLHGNQEYEFRRPLREGETFEVRCQLGSIRVLGGNAFLILVTELVEPGGDIVCIGRSTLIERAAD
jgi:N-terminal half of MaoC dehydratase